MFYCNFGMALEYYGSGENNTTWAKYFVMTAGMKMDKMGSLGMLPVEITPGFCNSPTLFDGVSETIITKYSSEKLIVSLCL